MKPSHTNKLKKSLSCGVGSNDYVSKIHQIFHARLLKLNVKQRTTCSQHAKAISSADLATIINDEITTLNTHLKTNPK